MITKILNNFHQNKAVFIFTALVLSGICIGLVSQNTSESQGTALYVNTKSGLILRKEADKKSQKLDLIPYGQKVISDQSVLLNGSLDDANGWTNVKYKDKEGFAASEFLSFYDPKKPAVSHWKCKVMYNYNPGKETYHGELILFKDGSYMTISSGYERSIGDQGTYVQTGNKISFKSRMDQTPEDSYIIKKYLIESKDKKLLDKDPNLIVNLEKRWDSILQGKEYTEENKIEMNVCSLHK